ncbi:hypothetical protein BDN70DRAFT_975534 [Pholiota conissans]|uniref:Uncharacterized protein n=1 Tax=Pholiota conissans TaxID=109636 RepID=A0A9P5YN54_9AGAR|nr:hypothetical protein BDN70DRAFT_975534 [Pholiota conissans]
MPYLPGSFDRPPRNPADKVNNSYKAWECLAWIYGLGPALLTWDIARKVLKELLQACSR